MNHRPLTPFPAERSRGGPAPRPAAAPRVVLGMRAFVVALLAMVSFAAAFQFPPDYDSWWHLATGRYIVSRHALPVPDPFSFTATGRTWIAHEWLAQLLSYAFYTRLGMAGPSLLYALFAAATVVITLDTLRRVGTRLLTSAAWTLVLFAVIWPFSGPRPQVIAFAIMATVVWLLERWLRRPDASIWLLPLLFVLWANMHGSFAVGLAAPFLLLGGEIAARRWDRRAGPRLAGRDLRRLGVSACASVAAVIVNPNGPALLLYPASKFGNPLLKRLNHWNGRGLDDPGMWAFFLLAGALVALMIVRRPHAPLADLLMAGAYTAAALWSFRVVPFAGIALVPVLGRVLTRPNAGGLATPRLVARLAAWRDEQSRAHTVPSAGVQIVNGVVLALVATTLAMSLRPYDPAKDARLPVAAVDALGSEGLPGPLLNDFDWGGYLIWRLWPRTRVFIDGRSDDLYMAGGELQQYMDLWDIAVDPEQLLDERGIRTVLFPKRSALVRYLLADGRWRATYDDGTVVRLERRSSQMTIADGKAASLLDDNR